MLKRQVSLLTFGLLMCLAATARGQGQIPLIDLDYFYDDHQYFAPAVWEDLGRNRSANTGWFAKYDRMASWVSRPNNRTRVDAAGMPVGSNGGDWTWGNLTDIGFMTEQDHGWLFSGYEVLSPNANEVFRNPQIGIYNDTLPPWTPQDPTDPDDPQIREAQNNQFTNQKDFDALTSINDIKVTSIEMMKTFRMPCWVEGGYWETMIGMRYYKALNYTHMDSYARGMLDMTPDTVIPQADMVVVLPDGTVIVTPTPPVIIPGEFTGGVTFVGPLDPAADVEFLTVDKTKFSNNLVLAQIGCRLQVPHGRWTLNHELRAFCGNNWQQFDRRVQTDSFVTDDGIDYDDAARSKVKVGANFTEFVFGTEARAGAAYHVTRDLMVHGGVHYQYVAQGIGRGNNPFLNEQQLGIFSAVFGLTYNR